MQQQQQPSIYFDLSATQLIGLALEQTRPLHETLTWLGVQSSHWTSEAALDDLERLIDRLHCAQKLTPWRV
jgi:hypothetical protein